ncbi:unnamed protein product [Sphagnum jensenii]
MKVPVKLSLLANVTKASLSHVFLSDAPDPRMDQDLEPEMVEDIMLGSFLTFSHKSSSPILAPFFTRSGDKQIVKNHIDVVVIIYPLFQMLHIILPVEDPTVAHDTAASPIHPDDNTDEVIELDLTMGEEVEAKDTEGAAGNQAIGK